MNASHSQDIQQRIRYFAAEAAALIGVIYFLIGLRVLNVVQGDGNQVFGLFAGVAYTFGAWLLLAFDRRIYWVVGAALQIFVIFTYFNMASQRTPAFEVCGLILRVIQVVLLVALISLIPRASGGTVGQFSHLFDDQFRRD